MCDGLPDNPFCINRVPTDPYNWIQYNNRWYYAIHNYETLDYDNVYFINNNFYYCSIESGCEIMSGNNINGLIPVTSTSIVYSGFSQDTCPSPAGYENYVALPNKRTGACEKTGLNSPCVNPCVRLDNGSLAVNSQSSQCRVFPNVTEGGNASINNNSCPTVCPSACVELWESCPPGSGPLTTLAQTKTPTDLYSLSGPYRQDLTPNPLWPTNYVNTLTNANPILGKPYTECYSYNTEFCDLPMGWQLTVPEKTFPAALGIPSYTIPQSTTCYSSCPQGTYPDPSDPQTCLFLAADGNAQNSSSTNFQKVFCNPQYFNPVYLDVPNAGIQKGCQSRPLPSKQGSSCPEGTSPIVNEFFNLEWCLPNCPQGYFFDLSQSTCVSTCEGTTSTKFNSFLDIFSFYADTNRCKPGTNCIQDNTPGRCPIAQKPVNTSDIFSYSLNTPASKIPISYTSMDPSTSQLNVIADAQKSSDQNLGQCPPNMSFGLVNSKQLQKLCYDNCLPGYEPVEFCANGQSSCTNDNLIFSCRAQCPSHSEGLGPWREVNLDGIFTCAYNYPGNVVPSDPNLWATCPDDGRYTILQNLSASDASVLASAARKENLCIRKSYLRRVTCPLGFTENGQECQSACDASDVLVELKSGEIICQGSNSQTSRHDIDLAALVDSHNSKQEFRSHVLTRKSFSRGLGTDPNVGVSNSLPLPSWFSWLVYLIVGIVVTITIIFKVL